MHLHTHLHIHLHNYLHITLFNIGGSTSPHSQVLVFEGAVINPIPLIVTVTLFSFTNSTSVPNSGPNHTSSVVPNPRPSKLFIHQPQQLFTTYNRYNNRHFFSKKNHSLMPFQIHDLNTPPIALQIWSLKQHNI